MSEPTCEARIVLSTAAHPEEAARIGRILVEERLAACATVVPGVRSIYHWQGAVEEAAETLMLVKTTAAKVEALEARLRELHSYDVPEFLVLTVEGGGQAYLDWLRQSVREPEG